MRNLNRKRLAVAAMAALFVLPAVFSFCHAQDKQEPAKFLSEARAKHLDLTEKGLVSLSVSVGYEIQMGKGKDKNRDKGKGHGDFAPGTFKYTWTAPDKDECAFDEKVAEGVRNSLSPCVEGLWRDLTGAMFFDAVVGATDLKLSTDKDGVSVSGSIEKTGPFRIVFEDGSGKLKWMEFTQETKVFKYELAKHGELYRIVSKECFQGLDLLFKVTYGDMMTVGTFVMPTSATVERNNVLVKFTFDYTGVNGEAPKVSAVDAKDTAAAIDDFQKNWSKLSVEDKKAQMGLISQCDDDKASAAVAKYGLADRDRSVQLEALAVLGKMGRKNVTPQVIAFFQTCDKNVEMYIAAAEALGKLNDPRGVDPLSKAFWSRDFDSQSDEARNAKADALGNIHHASSVETLIDLLIATGGRRGDGDARGQTVGHVVAALQKLTGQKFGRERDAWRDWWKDNKATFK